MLLLHLTGNALFLRRGDEYPQQADIRIPQDIVGAAAHKHALLPAGDAADLVALQGEQHLGRGLAPHDMVVALVDGAEQVGVGGLFIGIAHDGLR